MSRLVRAIKRQFFLTYGVMGSVLPFISVYMTERGLSPQQIGYVIGVGSVAVILPPMLMAALADTSVQGRRLMAMVFGLSGLLLLALLTAHGFWWILILFALHQLAFAPVPPLQDGVLFSASRARERRGLAPIAYHTVRVFGTVGYMIPALALYFVLQPGQGVEPALIVGVTFALLGCANTFTLPHDRDPAQDAIAATGAKSKLPTLAAARAMLEPHVLVFCIAMFMMYAASTAYYAFYPIYLTRDLGVEKRWVGLIINLGVFFEVFFVLGFGWLHEKLTLRGLIVTGILAQALRMLVLALWTNAAAAIAVQVVHGLTVIVMHVAPPMFLNRRAGDAYRNSIQGLYAMLIGGLSRVVGNIVAGQFAQVSLTRAFLYGAGLSIVAAGLVAMAFRDDPTEEPSAPDADEVARDTSTAPVAESGA